MPPDNRPPFDEHALLERAREKTGMEDFGSEEFRSPLCVLLSSLADAPLNPIGTTVLRASILRSLTQRLRITDWIRRHPEIEAEAIERPLVVVGAMRSGTTLMQRLLAADPRHTCAYGWEIGEPAPRSETFATQTDPRIADGVARSDQMRAFAPDLWAIHPTDALAADEEIVFLADAFLSHVPEASCHVPVYRRWLDGQEFGPAYEHLHRTLRFLQWQKRQRGEVFERWVLKTPAHLGYLENLFAEFPDAHVIHMHRGPLETIPSGASLNATLWRLYSDSVDPVEVGRQWLERMAWTTRRALAQRAAMPDEDRRFTDVWYRDAVSGPLAAAAHVYRSIGIGLPDDARRAMEAWLAADAAETRPRHHYAAADFGLSDTAIGEAFAGYCARFVAPFENA